MIMIPINSKLLKISKHHTIKLKRLIIKSRQFFHLKWRKVQFIPTITLNGALVNDVNISSTQSATK